MKQTQVKKENEIVSVDETNYQVGLSNLNDNLEMFIGLEKSFETITGSKEFKTKEYLDTFIKNLSGFPNLEASVKLLDFELPYNFIVNNHDKIDLTLVDTETKTLPKELLESLKEQYTTRLSDNAQTDYPKLIQIAKLYNEIKNSDTLHSIFSTDNRITWSVNLQSLNQIDKNIQRPM
jgi:hypothetical protein